ncbi:hypothetical protein GCM10028773_25410 [Spirosoma koreense]
MIDASEEQRYGINKQFASSESINLFPEEFFWDSVDEGAPFGSDEGDTALANFRRWRQTYPTANLTQCLKWVLEEVGETSSEAYLAQTLSKEQLNKQLSENSFDDQQYIYTLDASVIATGLGQLVDEGRIDKAAQPFISQAIDRQLIWSELQGLQEYNDHLKIMKERLKKLY